MNYANLTPQELLNYADPATELEKILYQMVSDETERADSLQAEIDDIEQQMEDTSELDELKSSIDGISDELSAAIDADDMGAVKEVLESINRLV